MLQDKALFNQKTVEKLCSKIKVTQKHKDAAKSWLYLLEQGSLKQEKLNYFKFGEYILKDLLGYDIKNMSFEEGNIEFSFKNKEGKVSLGIEAKGTKTKDLFSEQKGYRDAQKTPITQLWQYMGALDLQYGIATNYKEFILIDKNKGFTVYHFFDFESIRKNEQKLKEFIAIFSKEQILENQFVEKLEEASAIEERNFTKEFYKLFHETRLMMIKEFQEHGISREQSIHYAQLFLNRLMFIFFAEDTNLVEKRLFEEQIMSVLRSNLISDKSHFLCESTLILFSSLDKGSDTPKEIFGFNGGLFRETIPSTAYFMDLKDKNHFQDIRLNSNIKKELELDPLSKALFQRYENKLNPIIKNILLMSSFDFKTEVNVEILGHIFEQSLTDLEQLMEAKDLKRKKEGIFYTPQSITDYIAREAIFSYVSNKGAKTARDLVLENSQALSSLEDRVKTLKILDPACGSGAFLIKAVDILLEIHKEIQLFKQNQGAYSDAKKSQDNNIQRTLTKWKEEEEARKIIEQNIFGVDLNEESVEITKLSLFLKIATNNKKLLDLSKNIRCGNSLLQDSSVVRSFNWQEEFPFKFDIIIGNPPYVRMEKFKDIKPLLKKEYITHAERSDLYVYFYEKGVNLLKEGGVLGYITSNTFIKTDYGLALRRFLRDHSTLLKILNLGETQFFEGATTYPVIILLKKSSPTDQYQLTYFESRKITANEIPLIQKWLHITQKDLNDTWTIGDNKTSALVDILKNDTVPLRDFCGEPLMGIKTGFNEAFILDEKTKEELIKKDKNASELIKPFLMGKDLERWHTPSAHTYLIYVPRGKKIEQYPSIKEHLSKYKTALTKRATNQKWWELQQPQERYIPKFESKKIIYVDIANKPTFSLDDSKRYIANSVYFIPKEDYYLLCLLNSSLCKWFIYFTSRAYRGGYVTFRNVYVEQIPIKKISDKDYNYFKEQALKIIHLQKELGGIIEKMLTRIATHITNQEHTKKFQDFWKLNTVDFIKKLKTNTKSLSLKEEDEWHEHFNQVKEKILEKESLLNHLEKEIDTKLYDIYGVTKYRTTIEESLKA